MVSWSTGKSVSQLSSNRAQTRFCRDNLAPNRTRGRLLLALFSVFAALALALAWSSPARAADFSATQMKVSVWPEYDDPRVLIINQADVDPSVKLPAQVSFNIPKGAEIGMACEVDSSGGHNCKTYQLADKGDYQTLTYTVEKEHKIFLEYYYVAFAPANPTRSFDFTFRPTFPVTSFDLEVQEPLRSSAFTVEPALTQLTTDSQGLKYHSGNLGSLPVDKPLEVKVSYSKTDNNPSVKKADNASAGNTSSSAGAGTNRNRAVYVVVGVLAFGGVLFGGYRKLRPTPARASQSGQRIHKTRTTNRASRPPRAVAGEQAGPSAGARGRSGAGASLKYCTNCGSELQLKHRFCPRCGSEQS